jgi:hypothetical protein
MHTYIHTYIRTHTHIRSVVFELSARVSRNRTKLANHNKICRGFLRALQKNSEQPEYHNGAVSDLVVTKCSLQCCLLLQRRVSNGGGEIQK